jgi:hypothetical protein
MAFLASIYASDTDVLVGTNINKYPLITDLQAKVDILVMNFTNLRGLFGGIEVTSDTKTYFSGGELTKNTARFTWNIESLPYEYTSTENNYIEDIKNILSKKYKWLDIKNYPYRPSELNGILTKAIAINIPSWGWNNTDNTKNIIVNCKERP